MPQTTELLFYGSAVPLYAPYMHDTLQLLLTIVSYLWSRAASSFLKATTLMDIHGPGGIAIAAAIEDAGKQLGCIMFQY